MSVLILKSDEARQQWRTVLDKAMMGDQVVVERYARPEAVIVGYSQYNKMRERLEELELMLDVRTAKEKEKAGETKPISHDDLKRLLIERRNPGNPLHVDV